MQLHANEKWQASEGKVKEKEARIQELVSCGGEEEKEDPEER